LTIDYFSRVFQSFGGASRHPTAYLLDNKRYDVSHSKNTVITSLCPLAPLVHFCGGFEKH
jgi:hypothetical protein